MKILMVSMFAPHFVNWAEQLNTSGYEVYWLDVFDSNSYQDELDFAHQIIGWRYRWHHPGRYFLKEKFPVLTTMVNQLNQRQLPEFFEKKLNEIRPDVVHSFAMQSSCNPILNIMQRNPQIKWIYSSWGSDLYFYKNDEKEAAEIKKVLARLDYLFTDCRRDYDIAKSLGFQGNFLGVFPGGGGYDFRKIDSFIQPLIKKDTILIKGYQGKHGRCIPVLKAIEKLEMELTQYQIVVFGANEEVVDYLNHTKMSRKKNFHLKGKIPHSEVMKLLGKSIMYIGNSLSDGMPNTLLEAMIMGAFPIQSNPGGATSEVIRNNINGVLIEDPENSEEIKNLILDVLGTGLIESGILYNSERIKPTLERAFIKKKVLERYKLVEEHL